MRRATPSPTLPRSGGGRVWPAITRGALHMTLTLTCESLACTLPPPERGRAGEGVSGMPAYRNDSQRLHARALRASMTPAEQALWQALRSHRFHGLAVRRQAPVGPWIVDFLIPAHRFAIDLIDETHDRAADRAPASGLALLGYRCLHLPPRDVLGDLPATLRRLAREITA